jgi:hypothetical protein
MKNNVTINGVNIGDVFKTGNIKKAKVIDFQVVTSFKTGKLIGYKCIAKSIGTIATNEFEVPFATVIRNRII